MSVVLVSCYAYPPKASVIFLSALSGRIFVGPRQLFLITNECKNESHTSFLTKNRHRVLFRLKTTTKEKPRKHPKCLEPELIKK